MMKTPNPKVSKTTKSTCGAEIVGSIDDLLIQILVHLPLTPLIHFKLVSKHWNSIISDPRFQFLLVKEHNNSRAIGLIFQYYHWDVPIKTHVIVSLDDIISSNTPLPQIHNIPNTLRIFHSCQGLLVLTSTAAPEQYYVYNPTTNQITTPLLKDDEIKAWADTVHGMYLAFDPTKSPHYKVVCVWETSHVHQYQFEVYSSETGSWETSCGERIKTGYLDFNNGVYWNGAIHWVGFSGKSIYFNPDEHDDMPRLMPEPPPFIHPDYTPSYYFGESCGHLHCAGEKHMPRGIYVYEMMRDYSEWFLKFRVDDYSQFLRNIHSVPNIFCVVRGKKDSDSFLVLGNEVGEIIRYNLVHNTFQTIHDKVSDLCGYQTSSFQYIESLCSV